jgi:hypothetical protein
MRHHYITKRVQTIERVCGGLAISAFILVGALVGCHSGLFDPLVGAGPLPISRTNPFVGPNAFLGIEASRSSYLRNLFYRLGGPDAVDISSHTSMRLIYVRLRSYYLANKDPSESSSEWIIRGPFGMSRSEYRKFARTGLKGFGRPILPFEGRLTTFAITTPTPSPTWTPLPVPTVPQRKSRSHGHIHRTAPTASPTRHIPPIITAAATALPTTAPGTPLTWDQQALALAKAEVIRQPNGDLTHAVSQSGQTLGAIAIWYTGNIENAEKIAENNHIAPDAVLSAGTKVTIPAGLLKKDPADQSRSMRDPTAAPSHEEDHK